MFRTLTIWVKGSSSDQVVDVRIKIRWNIKWNTLKHQVTYVETSSDILWKTNDIRWKTSDIRWKIVKYVEKHVKHVEKQVKYVETSREIYCAEATNALKAFTMWPRKNWLGVAM